MNTHRYLLFSFVISGFFCHGFAHALAPIGHGLDLSCWGYNKAPVVPANAKGLNALKATHAERVVIHVGKHTSSKDLSAMFKAAKRQGVKGVCLHGANSASQARSVAWVINHLSQSQSKGPAVSTPLTQAAKTALKAYGIQTAVNGKGNNASVTLTSQSVKQALSTTAADSASQQDLGKLINMSPKSVSDDVARAQQAAVQASPAPAESSTAEVAPASQSSSASQAASTPSKPQVPVPPNFPGPVNPASFQNAHSSQNPATNPNNVPPNNPAVNPNGPPAQPTDPSSPPPSSLCAPCTSPPANPAMQSTSRPLSL
ncbi:MAG: hypothetical protein COV52_03675 [Gammaproteobacteria bacterium CG11_big_fil_rev_8_21_14_0_20_46_22]|nr:MAG: hypothetical protein COW05_05335 [Gammaproteobacteria bacterium CG12_big_fil_rev_8_21_14_0_65_46_12]PIR11505.1 MAG: hypothetical protein COV52_03675 [Gammaproteobacteria bacterium CG11_big_fil_rev_8_21_14_0_20_46_22]